MRDLPAKHTQLEHYAHRKDVLWSSKRPKPNQFMTMAFFATYLPHQLDASHQPANLYPFLYVGENNLLLVDPVVLSGLPGLNLTLLEPESNLLFGVLDGVGTVADIPSNVSSIPGLMPFSGRIGLISWPFPRLSYLGRAGELSAESDGRGDLAPAIVPQSACACAASPSILPN